MAVAGFWDRVAKRYAKSPVANPEIYQKKLQITRKYLAPDMEVLEFGCGTGSTAIAQALFVHHITAIDVSEKMLEIAKGKAEAAQMDNISFQRSGIEDFEPGAQKFDVVMAHSILHLLKDKEAVIGKVYAMLKPGGVFVSSTMCMGSRINILKIVLPIGHFFGLLPLVRFFSAETLKTSIVGAGFEIEHQWQPGKNKSMFMVARKPA